MQFLLNQLVDITISGEQGIVIGRAEYMTSEHQYLIRYCKRSTGEAVEAWWAESALTRKLG